MCLGSVVARSEWAVELELGTMRRCPNYELLLVLFHDYRLLKLCFGGDRPVLWQDDLLVCLGW